MARIVRESTRLLRKYETASEKTMWQILRNRKLVGKRFVRQYAISFEYEGRPRFFIADFYCHEVRLVIELDGQIHDKQVERDKYRTYLINQIGFRVIRIRNEELEDISKVIERIKEFL